MSLIYQALRQLDSDTDTPVESPAAPSPASDGRDRRHRRWWWAGAVVLVLLATGLGAIWGAHRLADRLRPLANQAHAEKTDHHAVGSQAVADPKSAPQPLTLPASPPAAATVRFFAPDVGNEGEKALAAIRTIAAASPDNPLTQPSARLAGTGADDDSPPGSDRAPPHTSERTAVDVPGMDGSTEGSAADTAADGDPMPGVVAQNPAGNSAMPAPASVENPMATTDSPLARSLSILPSKSFNRNALPQWSAEEEAMQRARLMARDRSARIGRLVQQLETAVARDPEDNARINALLTTLGELQGPDHLYLIKMRAYWLFRRGDLSAARSLFERVVAADAADLEAGINLALIEARTEQRQTALDRLQRLRLAHPENLQVADLLRRLQ